MNKELKDKILKVGIVAAKHAKEVSKIDKLLKDSGYDVYNLRQMDSSYVDCVDYGLRNPDFEEMEKFKVK